MTLPLPTRADTGELVWKDEKIPFTHQVIISRLNEDGRPTGTGVWGMGYSEAEAKRVAEDHLRNDWGEKVTRKRHRIQILRLVVKGGFYTYES